MSYYAAPPPPPRRHRPLGPVVAGAAVALLLVAVSIFVIPPMLARPQHQEIGGPRPTSTTATTSNSPSPSTLPTTGSPYTTKPDPRVNCARGEPGRRTSPEVPGQLSGGGLLAPEAAAWEPLRAPLLFASDVQAQKVPVSTDWINIIAVGSLERDDGFTNPEIAARAAMDCMATAASFYPGLTHREEVVSRSLTISGHPAWHVRQVFYVSEPANVKGDVIDVIVVEVSESRPLGFFTGSATIGHADIQSLVDKIGGQVSVG